MKRILKLWGCICLIFAAIDLGMYAYAVSSPTTRLNLGPISLGEWIGMGLISLGLARVIELLEKK